MFSKSISHAMGRGGRGEVLPVMAYTGRLLQKEVPFRLLIHRREAISLFGVYKSVGKSVTSLKEPKF